MNKYISGIVRNRGHKVLAINGTRDHIHILVSMSRDLNLSDPMERMLNQLLQILLIKRDF